MALHIEGNEVVLSILGSLILYLAFTSLSQKATSSLPGPSGWPIIGNLFDLNVEYLYATCNEWKKKYGDVFQLSVLGGTMVVIGSADAANELLERRGTKYSGRPDMPMITELMGWEWSFTFMPYGNRWREQRRLFVNNYHGGMIEHKVPAFEEVQKLLVSLLDSPKDFSHHLKTYTAGLIIKRTYGYNVTSMNDPLLRLVDDTNKTTSIAVTPGAFWVNLFPKMKYIPEWILPGGGFKRQAREWRKLTDAMVEVPFQMVKEQVMTGTSSPSFVSKCLDLDSDPQRTPLTDKLIKETAAVAYAAGADTTFSVLGSFMLAMTLYPKVQKRMQAELDSVCSVERFPVFEDRPQLPYTDSVLVEVMRLTPPLPLAVPHRLDEADTFRGKYIPKGSVILANVWAILHDEEVFEDPFTFKPERYINNPALRDKALNAIFGYGRRSCAGKGLALDTAWIAMVSIIAAFDISKAVDKNGNEINFEVKILPGSASHVRPFPCKITPRSSSSTRMIKELVQELS